MTKLVGKQIALDSMSSVQSGNLMRYDGGGLYMALAAAANVQTQYVSSSTGSDSNDGSINAPLKTIAYALSRLPENTSGTILLYESDTFPVRPANAPQTWGGTTTSFGYAMSTGLRNVSFIPYGPQSTTLEAAFVNVINIEAWMVRDRPRPVLEFGHYMFQGRPVGCAFIAGADSGQFCAFYGIEFRITDEARAACQSTGIGWTAGGYAEILPSSNGGYRGCVMPAPIVIGGTTQTRIVGCYNEVNFWNSSVPAASSVWISANGCTNINFADTGTTIVDRNGTSYATVPNTVVTNITTRMQGIVKDSNGVTRNVFSNLNI